MAENVHLSLENNEKQGPFSLYELFDPNPKIQLYLKMLVENGSAIGGHYLSEIDELTALSEEEKEEERSFFFRLTLEETRRELERNLADIKRRIEENQLRMEEIDREIKILERSSSEEEEKIKELKKQKEELEEQQKELEEKKIKTERDLERMNGNLGEAKRDLMTMLTRLNPDTEKAGQAMMEIAASHVVIEARLKGEEESQNAFHPVFKDENGELYILHPSKGRTALKDMQAAAPEIDDLEKHARWQEKYGEEGGGNKKFLSSADKATADSYYENVAKFHEGIKSGSEDPEDTLKIVKAFREKHRYIEGQVYKYHELHEEKEKIEQEIQDNKNKIEEIEKKIAEKSKNIEDIEKKIKELNEEKERLTQETSKLQNQAEDIKAKLREIDTSVRRQITTIESYGVHTDTPINIYEKIAKERFSGCMTTVGTPEEVMEAARALDKTLASSAMSRSASDKIIQHLNDKGYESRHAQLQEKYGDNTSGMKTDVLTTKDADGNDVPVYRNDKTGSLYTLGEDGKKVLIKDAEALAALTLTAYIEGRPFANEADIYTTNSTIPEGMLTNEVFEKWARTPERVAIRNTVNAAETYAGLTQMPDPAIAYKEKPAEESPSRPESTLTGNFNNHADGANTPPEAQQLAPASYTQTPARSVNMPAGTGT